MEGGDLADQQQWQRLLERKLDRAASCGKFKVHTEVTQREVDNNFAMFVPIFADFGQGMVRLTQVGIAGNSTKSHTFFVDRQPRKVAINAYKEILER